MSQNPSWFFQSLVALILLAPIWLLIGFFERNFKIHSQVFVVWYFLGVAIASAFFGGQGVGKLIPSLWSVTTILLIGLTLGGVANIQLFKAVAVAPNPGLPVAIANGASVLVFLSAFVLSRLLPNYFNSAKWDWYTFLGVILTFSGVGIIAIRR